MSQHVTLRSGPPTPWRWPLFVLSGLLVLLLVLYWPTASGMALIWWRSDTYAHGLVVPFASIWLIWRKRAELAPMTPHPSWSALLCLIGAAMLWLAGDLVAVNAATQWALVSMVVLAVPAVLGWPVAKVLAFPLGFLFLAVPVGDFMLPQLMAWTADFTIAALRLSGIPVYREGLQFIIPSGSWSVVEACSGIRYLVASVTVGCLFAYLNYSSLRKRLLFMGVSILVPLLANWLRAYMIVMLGHLSGNELATGVDHLVYGWLFFGLVMTIMFVVGARWSESPSSLAALVPRPSRQQTDLRRVGLAAGASALVLLAPHALAWRLQASVSTHEAASVALAPQEGWHQSDPPSEWGPAFQHASVMSHTGFVSAQGQAVGLHVAYYRDQNYQRKLVSSENMLVTSKDEIWARVSGGSATTALDGQPTVVETAELLAKGHGLASAGLRMQAWQFFWVGGRITASPVRAKLYGALQKAMGQGDDGAIVVIYTTAPKSEADALLQDFVRTHGHALLVALKQTQSRY